MKTCTKCKRTLPLDMFLKNIHYKDGYTTICKDCRSEYYRDYALRHNLKKYKQAVKQRKIDMAQAGKILGGYRIYVLNHPKKSEFKYTAVKVQTEDIYKTNDKGQFLRFLGENI